VPEIGEEDEVGTLLGRNGMGSTLVRTILDVLAPSDGVISFEGANLAGLPPSGSRVGVSDSFRRGASYVST
jgi:ABC-type branched-subunit amino acid transport system ATPase component